MRFDLTIWTGQLLLVENPSSIDHSSDTTVMDNLGGGRYVGYTNMGWGSTHSSLDSIAEPLKSETALCFKQSESLKIFQCEADGTMSSTELSLTVTSTSDVSSLRSTPYTMPATGVIPHNCFYVTPALESLSGNTVKGIVNQHTMKISIDNS